MGDLSQLTDAFDLINDDEEWVNVPPIVRLTLRHLLNSQDVSNNRLASLQENNKQSRQAIHQWAEYTAKLGSDVKESLSMMNEEGANARHQRNLSRVETETKVKDAFDRLQQLEVALARSNARVEELERHIKMASDGQRGIGDTAEIRKIAQEEVQPTLDNFRRRIGAIEELSNRTCKQLDETISVHPTVKALERHFEELTTRVETRAAATTSSTDKCGKEMKQLKAEFEGQKQTLAQLQLYLDEKARDILSVAMHEQAEWSNRLSALDRIVDSHSETLRHTSGYIADTLTRLSTAKSYQSTVEDALGELHLLQEDVRYLHRWLGLNNEGEGSSQCLAEAIEKGVAGSNTTATVQKQHQDLVQSSKAEMEKVKLSLTDSVRFGLEKVESEVITLKNEVKKNREDFEKEKTVSRNATTEISNVRNELSSATRNANKGSQEQSSQMAELQKKFESIEKATQELFSHFEDRTVAISERIFEHKYQTIAKTFAASAVPSEKIDDIPQMVEKVINAKNIPQRLVELQSAVDATSKMVSDRVAPLQIEISNIAATVSTQGTSIRKVVEAQSAASDSSPLRRQQQWQALEEEVLKLRSSLTGEMDKLRSLIATNVPQQIALAKGELEGTIAEVEQRLLRIPRELIAKAKAEIEEQNEKSMFESLAAVQTAFSRELTAAVEQVETKRSCTERTMRLDLTAQKEGLAAVEAAAVAAAKRHVQVLTETIEGRLAQLDNRVRVAENVSSAQSEKSLELEAKYESFIQQQTQQKITATAVLQVEGIAEEIARKRFLEASARMDKIESDSMQLAQTQQQMQQRLSRPAINQVEAIAGEVFALKAAELHRKLELIMSDVSQKTSEAKQSVKTSEVGFERALEQLRLECNENIKKMIGRQEITSKEETISLVERKALELRKELSVSAATHTSEQNILTRLSKLEQQVAKLKDNGSSSAPQHQPLPIQHETEREGAPSAPKPAVSEAFNAVQEQMKRITAQVSRWQTDVQDLTLVLGEKMSHEECMNVLSDYVPRVELEEMLRKKIDDNAVIDLLSQKMNKKDFELAERRLREEMKGEVEEAVGSHLVTVETDLYNKVNREELQALLGHRARSAQPSASHSPNF